MCRTPVGVSGALSQRLLWNCLLIRHCLAGSQHGWGQNCNGPGCSSYFEHISSTDCALSFFSNSLPVFCLLFRHRNLLSAVWVWPLNQIPCCGYDLYSKSVAIELPES